MIAVMRWKLALAALPAAYAVFLGATYVAMKQPPEQFARYMSALPGPTMALLPFAPLWNSARAGALRPGDLAPEFDLPSLDRQQRIRLSEFRAGRPVVLIFGSFT
jgi:hypothetical protein